MCEYSSHCYYFMLLHKSQWNAHFQCFSHCYSTFGCEYCSSIVSIWELKCIHTANMCIIQQPWGKDQHKYPSRPLAGAFWKVFACKWMSVCPSSVQASLGICPVEVSDCVPLAINHTKENSLSWDSKRKSFNKWVLYQIPKGKHMFLLQ